MRAFVIGDPIDHSLSPVLHRAAYATTGLKHSFDRQLVTATQLPSYLASLPLDLLGLAVTMPHKQAVIESLDQIEPLAKAVGAVNTVVASGKILTGFNTDVFGIVESLVEAEVHSETIENAVIIGSGATAASAVAALGQLHIGHISVIARRFDGPTRILAACARMGINVETIPWRDLDRRRSTLNRAGVIISTVPARISDEMAEQLHPTGPTVLLDAAYDPWPSKLAQAAKSADATICSGHLMLLHQARQQFTLMTGLPAPSEAMRGALQEAVRVAIRPQ